MSSATVSELYGEASRRVFGDAKCFKRFVKISRGLLGFRVDFLNVLLKSPWIGTIFSLTLFFLGDASRRFFVFQLLFRKIVVTLPDKSPIKKTNTPKANSYKQSKGEQILAKQSTA